MEEFNVISSLAEAVFYLCGVVDGFLPRGGRKGYLLNTLSLKLLSPLLLHLAPLFGSFRFCHLHDVLHSFHFLPLSGDFSGRR